MLNFKWIIPSLTLYYISIALFVFLNETTEFWTNYYWFINSYLMVICMLFCLCEDKSDTEKSLILSALFHRLLMVAYFLFVLIAGRQARVINVIVFFATLGISSVFFLRLIRKT